MQNTVIQYILKKHLRAKVTTNVFLKYSTNVGSKKISNDQELIQSDPTSCPQNQKGNN